MVLTNTRKDPYAGIYLATRVTKKIKSQHIGYYPDNVFTDQPRLSDLQKHFSLPFMP